MIKLFVGLGNPGTEYEATRHNAGFWWLDALSRELKAPLSFDKSYYGQVARTTIQGQNVWLLAPQTNLSSAEVANLTYQSLIIKSGIQIPIYILPSIDPNVTPGNTGLLIVK